MKKLKKYLIIPVICFMLAVLFAPANSLSVSAYIEEDFNYNKAGYLSFTLEDYDTALGKFIPEKTVMTSGNVKYTFHYLPFGVRKTDYNSFYYGNSLVCEYENGINSYTLISNGKTAEVIYAKAWKGQTGYFSTDEAEVDMRAFFDGTQVTYMFCSNNFYGNRQYALCDEATIDEINVFYANKPAPETFELDTLINYELIDLHKCDSGLMFEKNYIKFFNINNSVYTVCLDELDNSYINGNGDLCYRNGTIELYKVDEVAPSLSETLLSGIKTDNGITEDETLNEFGTISDDNGFIIFCKCLVWFIYILLGIILPIGVAIFAIVKLANLDKSAFKYGDKKRCWVTIIIASSVLIALTLLVMLIMVLP